MFTKKLILLGCDKKPSSWHNLTYSAPPVMSVNKESPLALRVAIFSLYFLIWAQTLSPKWKTYIHKNVSKKNQLNSPSYFSHNLFMIEYCVALLWVLLWGQLTFQQRCHLSFNVEGIKVCPLYFLSLIRKSFPVVTNMIKLVTTCQGGKHQRVMMRWGENGIGRVMHCPKIVSVNVFDF